jgi:SAM-dependent methyltransferase
MASVSDRWAAGSTYEGFMGRWSRQLAVKFLSWLQVPPGAHWLDVGCGTGALTVEICERARPASVVGCDPAEAFIEYARERHADKGCSFAVGGAGTLPTRSGGFGSVTSSLALNFFADIDAAVSEMHGLIERGGVLSASVWDYSGRMDFLRYFWDAVSLLDPDARDLDEGVRFPMCRPEALTALFGKAGLRDIRCAPIEIATEFADFHDYWQPFLGGTGPAPSYVASLDEERRQALASTLQRSLPRRQDGTIALVARAWAVRGSAT